jgi:hypothetical protein
MVPSIDCLKSNENFIYKIYLTNSVSCGLDYRYRHRHRYQPSPSGPDRHRPALTGLDRHKTGTDRPGLFYDFFDKNFQNIMPIMGYLIQSSYQKRADRYRPVPIGADRCRSVPTGAGAADRPQETLY